MLALFEAENYSSLIDVLTDIINNRIPETKARLNGSTTHIGQATSADGLVWTIEEAPVIAGAADTPWSGVGRPCVIMGGGVYEMWFTQGVDALTAQNLVNLWQGTTTQ